MRHTSRAQLLGNFRAAAALYPAALFLCAAACAWITYFSLLPPHAPAVLKAALSVVVLSYYLFFCAILSSALVLLEAAQRLLLAIYSGLCRAIEYMAELIANSAARRSDALRTKAGTAFASEAKKALGHSHKYATGTLVLFFALLGFMVPALLRRKGALAAAPAVLASLQWRLMLFKLFAYAALLLSYLLPPLLFA